MRTREPIRDIDGNKDAIRVRVPYSDLVIERGNQKLLDGWNFLDERDLGSRLEAPCLPLSYLVVSKNRPIHGFSVGLFELHVLHFGRVMLLDGGFDLLQQHLT